MPGLKALADQLPPGKIQLRGSTYYSSLFALGSGGSILVAGVTAQYLDWCWAFIFAGAGGLCAFLIVAAVLPARQPKSIADNALTALDFRPVLRDGRVMSYVVSSLGTAWEVFCSRVWLVTFFLYAQFHLPAGDTAWSPAVWATLVAFVGVPAAMAVGEICVRFDRRKILMGIALTSSVLSISIGFATDVSYELVVLICLIFGMTSYGRSAAINAGTIAGADPARRGSALAVLAFIGFSGGILGPLVYGVALDYAGGSGDPLAW